MAPVRLKPIILRPSKASEIEPIVQPRNAPKPCEPLPTQKPWGVLPTYNLKDYWNLELPCDTIIFVVAVTASSEPEEN